MQNEKEQTRAARNDAPPKASGRGSPGCLTYVVLYLLGMAAFYFSSFPQVYTTIDESLENHFYVAGVVRDAETGQAQVQPFTLRGLKQPASGPRPATFLLPPGDVHVDADWDHHSVTVLERHPDWQLVEYYYGNTREAFSTYRAFQDHVEPVSYRVVASVALGFAGILLVVPVVLLSALVNFFWARVARR